MSKFTAHKKFGIGEVVSVEGGFMSVYYAEIDETKKTILAISPATYETIEEAQAVLCDKEEAAAIANEAAREEAERKMAEGRAACQRLREYNDEMAKRQMRHI